ncbi:MAG: hypothetical protein ACOVKV_10335, partial [Novosphingobium sp.]
MAKQRGVDRIACLASALDGVADFDMLEFERDLRPLMRDGADRRGLRIVRQGGRSNGVGLRRAEQEGGLTGPSRLPNLFLACLLCFVPITCTHRHLSNIDCLMA